MKTSCQLEAPGDKTGSLCPDASSLRVAEQCPVTAMIEPEASPELWECGYQHGAETRHLGMGVTTEGLEVA